MSKSARKALKEYVSSSFHASCRLLIVSYRAEAAQDQTPDKEGEKDADEEAEEEPTSFQEIDKLQNLGINAGDIQKLKTGV